MQLSNNHGILFSGEDKDVILVSMTSSEQVLGSILLVDERVISNGDASGCKYDPPAEPLRYLSTGFLKIQLIHVHNENFFNPNGDKQSVVEDSEHRLERGGGV